jgi:hypothetical protein
MPFLPFRVSLLVLLAKMLVRRDFLGVLAAYGTITGARFLVGYFPVAEQFGDATAGAELPLYSRSAYDCECAVAEFYVLTTQAINLPSSSRYIRKRDSFAVLRHAIPRGVNFPCLRCFRHSRQIG